MTTSEVHLDGGECRTLTSVKTSEVSMEEEPEVQRFIAATSSITEANKLYMIEYREALDEESSSAALKKTELQMQGCEEQKHASFVHLNSSSFDASLISIIQKREAALFQLNGDVVKKHAIIPIESPHRIGWSNLEENKIASLSNSCLLSIFSIEPLKNTFSTELMEKAVALAFSPHKKDEIAVAAGRSLNIIDSRVK